MKLQPTNSDRHAEIPVPYRVATLNHSTLERAATDCTSTKQCEIRREKKKNNKKRIAYLAPVLDRGVVGDEPSEVDVEVKAPLGRTVMGLGRGAD